MVIVGGTYFELCSFPEWSGLFGSGGRAAAALASLDVVELHTFVPERYEAAVRAALAPFNVQLQIYRSSAAYEFHYIHPLSRPVFYTDPPSSEDKFQFRVDTDVALRFGFMEGAAIVCADRVVYDPQSPEPESYGANGSTANHLAYVLNESELGAMYPGHHMDSAARLLMVAENAEVVLIKRGVFGVRVVSKEGNATSIPAFQTAHVFKIGSGDIFSAVFAYQWGLLNAAPIRAAWIASQSAAWYCDTRSLPIADQEILDALTPVTTGTPQPIY